MPGRRCRFLRLYSSFFISPHAIFLPNPFKDYTDSFYKEAPETQSKNKNASHNKTALSAITPLYLTKNGEGSLQIFKKGYNERGGYATDLSGL
jgi:hypothetical protein